MAGAAASVTPAARRNPRRPVECAGLTIAASAIHISHAPAQNTESMAQIKADPLSQLAVHDGKIRATRTNINRNPKTSTTADAVLDARIVRRIHKGWVC